jgi:hypothetical protein
MGAYSNPQEIEGQQDLAGNARALQGMFNTIVGSAQNASDNITKIRIAGSEKILQENKQRAAKNDALLKDLDEREQGMQVLLEKGKTIAPKGMNYDCYDTALNEWRGLQLKIDKGEGSPADKRKAAQILASVDGFVKGAANTSGVVEKIKVARNNIGDGKIDTNGSDPNMLRAYIALESRDGNKIQPGFQTTKDGDENISIDYSQPGYNILEWKETVDGKEIIHPEQFISATKLEESLNGGSDGGIIFQKSFESDNEKVRKAYQADKEGNGIFEYKGEAYTNRVTSAYLGDGYTKSTQVGTQGTGGVTRQPMRIIDKKKILTSVGTTIESVSTAAASNPKEAASRYFNYIQPAMSEDNPNKDQYKSLPDYAKFVEMPDKFDYNSTINIDDKTGLMEAINKNSKAAFIQSIPASQAFGNPITISDKELAWEKEANKNVPKGLKAIWDQVNENGGSEIKTIDLGGGKIRNVVIAKDEQGKMFLEIVGYNTKQ